MSEFRRVGIEADKREFDGIRIEFGNIYLAWTITEIVRGIAVRIQ